VRAALAGPALTDPARPLWACGITHAGTSSTVPTGRR